ncbi:hypothetical protein [Halorhabdus amylolytica]|uniref:hypothetical protein n=1 Tax=Halorhabdus amylolytica TaxID=2559573 RepID=UPI0010AA13B5|nr:hypothetical protein [Halorhabdus amylolytica]
MTRSRPSLETDLSERWASWQPVLVAVGLAVVMCMTVLTGSVAGMPSGDADDRTAIQNTSTGTNLTYPPPNLNTTIVIFPKSSFVRLEANYPVRSMAEQRRYRNKTANISWFKTDDALERAFRERGEHLAKGKEFSTWSNSRQDPELGEGYIGMTFSWNEGAQANPHTTDSEASSGWDSAFSGNQSELVLGPTVSDHLPNGTVVRIEVPADTWVAENTTVQWWKSGPHQRTHVYAWTVNQTETEPRVVFNRSVLGPESTSESGPFGPAGGIILSLLAVFLAVGLQSRF